MVLFENKEFAINGKQKDSAPEETSVVSSTTVMSVQNQQKTAPKLSHQHKRGRSASGEGSLRGWSPSGKSNRQPCKNFLEGSWRQITLRVLASS